MYFKNQVFNLEDTTNNKIESTSNKKESVRVRSKYADLVQLFT